MNVGLISSDLINQSNQSLTFVPPEQLQLSLHPFCVCVDSVQIVAHIVHQLVPFGQLGSQSDHLVPDVRVIAIWNQKSNRSIIIRTFLWVPIDQYYGLKSLFPFPIFLFL